jgi:hypothetical protein
MRPCPALEAQWILVGVTRSRAYYATLFSALLKLSYDEDTKIVQEHK